MRADRAMREEESLADLAIAQSLGSQLCDLELLWRQKV
jgi:hypothetical protein